MKKITSKLVAVLMIVVMAFGISGTATVKTEAKESKGYVIKVNLGTNCTTVYKNGKAIPASYSIQFGITRMVINQQCQLRHTM